MRSLQPKDQVPLVLRRFYSSLPHRKGFVFL